MVDLEEQVKRVSLRLARLKAVRGHVRRLDNLHGLLRRQAVFLQLGIDLVFDVGANKGQFGKELRNFYDGEIISFEPVSGVFAELERVSAGDPKWTAKQFALGSENTTSTIHVANENEFSSFRKTNAYCTDHFGANSEGKREEVVTVRRLEDVMKEIPQVETRKICLKIDSQGYDMEVLKGLGSKLGSMAAIQCELSVINIYEDVPHWTENISFLERHGFGIVGLLPVTFDGLRVVEFDCLMVRL